MHQQPNVVGLDGAIISHPKVWEASGHTQSFADAMVEVLSNKELWDEMHEKALEDVKAFSVENVVPQYEKLFDNLMALRGFKQ